MDEGEAPLVLRQSWNRNVSQRSSLNQSQTSNQSQRARPQRVLGLCGVEARTFGTREIHRPHQAVPTERRAMVGRCSALRRPCVSSQMFRTWCSGRGLVVGENLDVSSKTRTSVNRQLGRSAARLPCKGLRGLVPRTAPEINLIDFRSKRRVAICVRILTEDLRATPTLLPQTHHLHLRTGGTLEQVIIGCCWYVKQSRKIKAARPHTHRRRGRQIGLCPPHAGTHIAKRDVLLGRGSCV